MLIINRHCFYSQASSHKARPVTFDREACFTQLITGKNRDDEFIVLLDTKYRSPQRNSHFVEDYARAVKIIEINEGTEGGSFRRALDIAAESGQTEVYFVEDDYAHKNNWRGALSEGIELNPNGFVTLYDHPDKYRDYPHLTSKLSVGKTCWWRTTPSTTNTYGCKLDALRKNLKVHYKHSLPDISTDHLKFLELGELSQHVISSIPGYSSHVEIDNQSPLYDRYSNR